MFKLHLNICIYRGNTVHVFIKYLVHAPVRFFRAINSMHVITIQTEIPLTASYNSPRNLAIMSRAFSTRPSHLGRLKSKRNKFLKPERSRAKRVNGMEVHSHFEKVSRRFMHMLFLGSAYLTTEKTASGVLPGDKWFQERWRIFTWETWSWRCSGK